MISFQETVRRIGRRLDRLVGRQDDHQRAEHYRELMERHLAQSNFYQGLLFHAWRNNRAQTKGLKRQAAKIKSLRAALQAIHDAPDGARIKAAEVLPPNAKVSGGGTPSAGLPGYASATTTENEHGT